MKKLAIFLAIMLIPFSAFALDTISDSDLDSVTGQAGVSIFTSSIQIVKTGVTTTYTDSNGTGNTFGGAAGNFSIVNGSTTTQIFFHGFDPLEIDVVDVADVIATVDRVVGAGTFNGIGTFGESAVQITLPNAIEIINVGGSTKTYYASDAAGTATASNEMIQITTTGGTTTISSALAKGADVAGGNHWTTNYDGALAAAGVVHADQVKLLITSHD
jgi:hypothetical protein